MANPFVMRRSGFAQRDLAVEISVCNLAQFDLLILGRPLVFEWLRAIILLGSQGSPRAGSDCD